ncbi:MAG: hypothetical protein IKE69_01430 [Thermoguttaceae bacterium]|nr:hypothetical protein [Thermoguttaceae bacterium]
MNNEIFLNHVSAESVVRYLKAKGWCRQRSPWDECFVYTREEPKPMLVYVPKSETDTKWNETMKKTVRELAVYEGRSEADVVSSLSSPFCDKIGFRVVSERADTHMLNFSSARKMVLGIIVAFKAAVKDVVSPGQYHSRLGGKEISEMMNTAQFGLTQPGSYVFNVFVPAGEPHVVMENAQFPLFDDCENLDDTEDGPGIFRQATCHLLKAVDSVVRGGVEPGTSGNFYEAIGKMDLWDSGEIEISADWSVLFAPPQGVPSCVTIRKTDFSSFIQKGNELKRVSGVRQTFSGFVAKLMGKTGDDGLPAGEVHVNVLGNNDTKMIRAKIELDRSLYHIATECHDRGVPVVFEGTLLDKGKPALIEKITGFRASSQAEDSGDGVAKENDFSKGSAEFPEKSDIAH